jgi:hypothetical protein
MSKLRELAVEAATAEAERTRIQREQEQERADRSAIQQAVNWCAQHLLPVDAVLEVDAGKGYQVDKVHVVIDDLHLEWVADHSTSGYQDRSPKGEERPGCFVIVPVVSTSPTAARVHVHWMRVTGRYAPPVRSIAGLGKELQQRCLDRPPYTSYRMATDTEVAAWVAERMALRLGFPS